MKKLLFSLLLLFCVSAIDFVFAGLPGGTCGNSFVEFGEQCDDGDTQSGDGCSSSCTIEAGYVCNGEPSSCVTQCGDGTVVGDEICDDGDTQSGDGCSSSCTIEAGYVCNGEPSNCVTQCGDGTVVGDEICDDGGTESGDGCSASCSIEQDYVCNGEPSNCHIVQCGDGMVDGTEQCDDGDIESGDGCSASCSIEQDYVCNGEPSNCHVIQCGDGMVDGTEQCDDGNEYLLDGCDNNCSIEKGFYCKTDYGKSVCSKLGDREVFSMTGNYDDNGNTILINGGSAFYMIYHNPSTNKTFVLKSYDIKTWDIIGVFDMLYYSFSTSISIDTDYNVYVLVDDVEGISLKKYNGNSWETLGDIPDISTYFLDLEIDGNNTPYVVSSDYYSTNSTSVIRYSGGNWETIPNGSFFAGFTYSLDLEIDGNNIPYLFYDKNTWGEEDAEVVKYVSGDWQFVGDTGFSDGAIHSLDLEIDQNNIPYVAYKDYVNGGKAVVMKFDQNEWGYVDVKGISDGGANNLDLEIDRQNNLYITYLDGVNGSKITTFSYFSGGWAPLGVKGAIGISNNPPLDLMLDNSGVPYIVYNSGSFVLINKYVNTYSSPSSYIEGYLESPWENPSISKPKLYNYNRQDIVLPITQPVKMVWRFINDTVSVTDISTQVKTPFGTYKVGAGLGAGEVGGLEINIKPFYKAPGKFDTVE